MLRGPQTPGELKGRTERLHPFGSLATLEEELDALRERELVARLSRRPGQKEDRYAQLLGGGEPDQPPPSAPEDDRVTALERRVAVLEGELAVLQRTLTEK
jgi:uncharacterized protein